MSKEFYEAVNTYRDKIKPYPLKDHIMDLSAGTHSVFMWHKAKMPIIQKNSKATSLALDELREAISAEEDKNILLEKLSTLTTEFEKYKKQSEALLSAIHSGLDKIDIKITGIFREAEVRDPTPPEELLEIGEEGYVETAYLEREYFSDAELELAFAGEVPIYADSASAGME